jgi:ketosteroid isomerase-like protein/truncated hemoglobin YjbI
MRPLLFLLALGLAVAAPARAQHDHAPADTAGAAQMHAMMAMHERMMADTLLHRRMMDAMRADPAMQAMMHEAVGGETPMDHDAEHGERMARMHERMAALSPEQRQAMMDAHRRVMAQVLADPEVRARMMADPEMHRMMGQMMGHEGGMHPDGGMEHTTEHGPDAEAEAAAVAERFYDALAAGDRAAVEALLLPEAVVLESGHVETTAEYFGHHFGADAAFLAGMTREPGTRTVGAAGGAAWVASTARLHGTARGRALDLDSAELLVLRRTPDGWRIAAVHWSSSPRD